MAVSSSTSQRITYDVFLSFRGEDTRYKLVDHIYDALSRQRGINTFRDDEKLRKGEEIAPALLKAIEESRVWIVVLSENYANSRWCLDELVKIVECNNRNKKSRETEGIRRKLYPIFYEVERSDVRYQKGFFGNGFDILVSRTVADEKVKKWKKALKEVAGLEGSPYPSPTFGGYESKFIQDLASKVFLHIKSEVATFRKDLVGIGPRVEKVIDLLQKEKDEVRVIGIWGMGGIGKSTIAETVYDRISHHFECSCYLSNVRENIAKVGDVTALQEKLIFELSKEKNLRVPNAGTGVSLLTRIGSRRKILIVLDDVDDSIEIDKLIDTEEGLGSGSRIIITTRDKHVLTNCDVNIDDIYKVEELDDDESTELFTSKAFGKGQGKRGYEELTERAVTYAGGIPLAVNVLASFVKGRSKQQWESAFRKLEEWPEEKIMKVLRLSYQGLDLTTRQIFLEIACCLMGESQECGMQLLDSYGLYAEIGIAELVDKYLVSVSGNEWKPLILMHDLIVELGRDIVRRESEEPGNRSRLWNHQDVKHVLTKNTGTKAVQSINLKSSKTSSLVLGAKAFESMPRIRFLRIHDVHLPDGLAYIPNEIRYLEWYRYPLENLDLSRTFYLEHLVELHMESSSIIQLWDGKVNLNNLKVMNLNYSKNLIKTPNFTGLTNLEGLTCCGCESLVEIHPSIAFLRKLVYFAFFNCQSLNFRSENMNYKSWPGMGNAGSVEFLTFLGYCSNLRGLDLSYCPNLVSLPDNIANITCLEVIHLDGTSIRELPKSMVLLKNLDSLYLSNCSKLESLPEDMKQLLNLNNLVLTGCESLQELPELTPTLAYLNARDCGSLNKISSPSIYIYFGQLVFENCNKLVENFEENILQLLLRDQFKERSPGEERSCFQITYPGNEIPKWFDDRKEKGSCISFTLPNDWYEQGIIGAAYCVASSYNSMDEDLYVTIHLNGKSIMDSALGFMPSNTSGIVCVTYLQFSDLIKPNHGENEISFADIRSKEKSHSIKSCGVGLIMVARKTEKACSSWPKRGQFPRYYDSNIIKGLDKSGHIKGIYQN